jgi:hypothetical protein
MVASQTSRRTTGESPGTNRAAVPGLGRATAGPSRLATPRTRLNESDADGIQLAQRLVVERHALGVQVLTQVSR